MFATLRRLSTQTQTGPRRLAKLPSTLRERPLPPRLGSSGYPTIANLEGIIPEGTSSPISHFVRNVWYLLYQSSKNKLPIRADGFVRVKDVTGRFPFRATTEKEFVRWAQRCHDSIDLVQQPNTYASTSEELLWWFRRKDRPVPRGVDQATYRLLPGTAVRNAIFRATLPEWKYIRENGLRPRPGTNLITMEAIDKIEETIDVVNTSHVYIFIDMEEAMKGGIDFYFTRYLKVVSPGNRDSVILPKYFKDAIEVVVEKEVLQHASEQQAGKVEYEEPINEELIDDQQDIQLASSRPFFNGSRRKPLTPWQKAIAG